jgi:hypothetical protein
VDPVKRTNLRDRSAAQLAEICDNSHSAFLNRRSEKGGGESGRAVLFREDFAGTQIKLV